MVTNHLKLCVSLCVCVRACTRIEFSIMQLQHGDMEVQLQASLTLAFCAGEWSPSSPSYFTSDAKDPSTH